MSTIQWSGAYGGAGLNTAGNVYAYNYTYSNPMKGAANNPGSIISDATYQYNNGGLATPTTNFQTCGPFTAEDIAINSIWVTVTATLVFFMQAGFAMLEVGATRMKNAGAVMGKILVNMSITWIMFWLIGWNLGFTINQNRTTNNFIGNTGFSQYVNLFEDIAFAAQPTQLCAQAGSSVQAQFYFQVVFCAVSVAIVWGTMLDRTKFIAYIIFATIFSGFIYPVVAHWTWGGGWLFRLGYQDFAGSSIVHLQGGVAAFTGTLVLGPRIGRFDSDGRPMKMIGHSLPLQVLGVLILWVGWMGFNPGSFLAGVGVNFSDVAVNTNLAGAAGVLGSMISSFIMFRNYDVNQMGNGAVAALVAITSPCAFVDGWAAIVIGLIAGLIVPPGELMFEKFRIDDPINCLTCHGLAGIWGTFSCGLFATPIRSFIQANNSVAGGFYNFVNVGSVGNAQTTASAGYQLDPLNRYKGHQLGIQIAGLVATIAWDFITTLLLFLFIKYTVGLRVEAEHEEAGLDISEHGAFGYPERFVKVAGQEGSMALHMPTNAEMATMGSSVKGSSLFSKPVGEMAPPV